jgi:hypothetical protein
MGVQNDCSPALDGKKAALDLANASSENFSNTCWNIDNRLKTANPEYARNFISAMNNELENRNLLPKVELNMVAQSNNPALETLQDRHKHIDTKDLVKAEDDLRNDGRNVESNLVHGLITDQDQIQDTHAERNFWGKNHGGIDKDRLQSWSDQHRADTWGAASDIQEAELKASDSSNKGNRGQNDGAVKPEDAPNKPKIDATKDGDISRLWPDLFGAKKAQEDAQKATHAKENVEAKKAQEDAQKAAYLKEKVEAGVKKEACHTVEHGETLYDMACLALHKAGRVHMTPGAIRFEEEKIRTLNHLAPHESLRSGQSLNLRTPAEVERETMRRVQMIKAAEIPEIKPAIMPISEEYRLLA